MTRVLDEFLALPRVVQWVGGASVLMLAGAFAWAAWDTHKWRRYLAERRRRFP